MRIIVAVLLACVVVTSMSCGPATATTPPRKYRVGMVHWAAYSPLNVAAAEGFWSVQGLDVEVVNYVDNSVLNADLQSRKIDFALDMIGSWVDLYMQGTPLTVLGETDWSHGGDKIVLKNGVTDLNALKGQKIGLYLKLLSVQFFLGRYLAEHNLKLTDFVVEQASGPTALADDFIASKYNIIVNYDPEAVRSVTAGDGKVVKTSRDFQGVIPEGFVARTDQLRGIPEADLVQFFKGWLKAVKWTKDPANRAAWYEILRTKTFEGEGPFTDADLTGFVNNVTIHDQATQLARNKTGGGLSVYFEEANAFAQANSLFSRAFSTSDVFDNTAIVKALSE